MPILNRFLHAVIMTISLIVMSACVPKATEKKAICGANQAFSSITRSCYSVVEGRHKPVGSTASATLLEETPKTIELTYTDANKDNALSCKITNLSANIEIISSGIADRSIFIKADEVAYAASSLGLLLTPGNSTAGDAINTALETAKNSFYYPNVASKMGLFKIKVESMLASASLVTGNTSVTYEAGIVKEKMQALTPFLTAMENRCECAAGKCFTTIIPKASKNGAASFTYSVTDVDGESTAKNVTVTITAMAKTTAHLAPVAVSSTATGPESQTSTAVAIPEFTLPAAADLSGAGPETFTYHYIGVTNGGTVSNCMGLNGTSNYDRTCRYTPANGNDENSTPLVKAHVDIDDIRFEAMVAGTAGNDLRVRILNLQADNSSIDQYVTKPGIYGLVNSSYNESFLRVVGNTINIFINPGVTTTSDIIGLVNNHAQAKVLIFADTIAMPTGAMPVARASTSLTGGGGAYDVIKYYVKNSAGVMSTNTASVAVQIEATDDLPVMITPLVAAVTIPEDNGIFTIDLKPFFTDSDTNGTTNLNLCNANFMYDMLYFDPNFTASINSTTCVVTLTPDADVSSSINTFDFQFRVATRSTVTGVTQWLSTWTTYKVTITPSNDLPKVSTAPITSGPVTNVPGQTIAEGASGSVVVYVDPGGSGFESSQTVSLTATSDDQALLPDANIVIEDVASPFDGRKKITYTPVANRSGTVNIEYIAEDSLGASSTPQTFVLTVTPVNNPPVFYPSVLPNVATNEGGFVQTDGIKVDEDAGGSPDENADGIRITIESDNPSVLPTNSVGAITLFYDANDNGVEDTPGETRTASVVSGKLVFNNIEGTASNDSGAHKFYLKLDPVDGISGNANLIVTATDAVGSTSVPFSFIVYPVAAQHGGWSNISSVGVKRDKNGNAVKVITDATTKELTSESDVSCNFNKSTETQHCSTGDCKGGSPNGTVIPTAKNVLYWDTDNNRCYRSTSNTQYSWVEFMTTCPVERTTDCRDNSCIYNAEVSAADDFPRTTDIPTRVGVFAYSTKTNSCYVSTGKISSANWEVFTPSRVTLGWKPFSIVGSGSDSFVTVAGYNVYRREANKDYNFKDGFLRTKATDTKTVGDINTQEFVDRTAIAGKVYYYTVRPIDSNHGFPTFTPEIYSEVRVLAAPANNSFVHRWMINQEMCNSMHMTTATTNAVDQSNNYRCPYNGPGESSGYFDYPTDLLVNTQELGCPYSPAPNCTANGCVGLGAPNNAWVMSGGSTHVYYNRSNGSCYIHNGTTWDEFQTSSNYSNADLVAKLNTSLNAPLVNLTQARAALTCAAIPAPTVSGFTLSQPSRLPNKIEFNAFAAHKTNESDDAILEMEQGFSLNLYSRCNGSSASGLEAAYSDSAIPSTSLIYSLPGSLASGIRSMYTGSVPWGASKGTEACVSRYGIQDVYGNVAEWTLDTMSCTFPTSVTGTTTCNANVVTNGSFKLTDFDNGVAYGFDGVTGPFNELTGNRIPDQGDGWMTRWTYSSINYNATKFSFPIAMPITSEIATPITMGQTVSLPVLENILNIGPSNGVTVEKLHEDGIIVSNKFIMDTVNPALTGTASFAVGGGYQSGNLSGRFTSELIPTTVRGPDVGLRCIVPIPKANYPGDTATVYPY